MPLQSSKLANGIASSSMSPSPPLALSILFSRLRNFRTASQVLQCHALLLTSGHLPASPLHLSNHLLLALAGTATTTYAAAGRHADLVFARIPAPNAHAFSWNTVIRLHASKNPSKALLYFSRMRQNAVLVDRYTFPAVLKACGCAPLCTVGVLVHAEAVKRGLDSDLFVRNGLISFYCRVGDCHAGRKVFDACGGVRDLVSWNSMVAGYVGSGDMEMAQNLFDEMPQRDVFSWAAMIDGYGKRVGDVGLARKLFDEMPGRDLVCWNSMIDGYARHGQMGEARELFEEMSERNVISWSVLIDGYVRHGDPKEALDLFQRMLRHGTRPDRVSAVGAIMACAQLGALEQGQWLHSYLEKKILFDVVVQTALIDMYMKCGYLDIAMMIFDSMPERSIVTWNVVIVGLGTHSYGHDAIKLFHQMEEKAPTDDLTILAVLTACTHAGLVSEGLEIFHRMRKDFGIDPKVEHYGALVDLLGRAGHLHQARHVIETMPMKPTSALWGSLLAACRSHRCVELAELSVERLASLGADDSGVYVLLSNIYADEGMWDDVWRIRKLISAEGMKKEIGRSMIEVDGKIHEFVNGGSSHPSKEEIYIMLWCLSNIAAST